MTRDELLKKIYSKKKLVRNFDYDGLWHAPISSYLSKYDLDALYKVAKSARLSAKPKEKFKAMDDIMRSRGFTRFASGTNRVVYKSEFDASILMKVGLDDVGIHDNIGEYHNQNVLKPFCAKMFDVSQNWVVGMSERVTPIQNRREFESVAGDVFDILNGVIIGKYVLEDIGCDFFMNWGIRIGFGPVLLDYPYCYILDGNKLQCTKVDPRTGQVCGGFIDYDDGINTLICERCGQRYTAKSLGKSLGLKTAQEIEKGVSEMENFTVSTIVDGKRYTFDEDKNNDTVIHKPQEMNLPKVKPVVTEQQKKPMIDKKNIVDIGGKLFVRLSDAKKEVAASPEFNKEAKVVVQSQTLSDTNIVKEDKKEEKPEMKTVSTKDRINCKAYLKELENKFDFSKYDDETEEYRHDIIEYLSNGLVEKYNIDKEVAENMAIDYGKDTGIISETEEEKYDKLAAEYGYDEEEEDMPRKTRKTRMNEF